MEYPLPRKESNLTNEILYIVTGKNAVVDNDKVRISIKKNAKSYQFLTNYEMIIEEFNKIKTKNDIIDFINKYGSLNKEETYSIDKILNEVKIYNILLKLIDIVNSNESTNILIEYINKIDFNFIYEYVKECEKEISYKEKEYSSENALKQLMAYSKYKYSIETDEDNKEIVFIKKLGTPIEEIIIKINYIINTLFKRILSNVKLDLYYDSENKKFRRYINVSSLLEAIYLYTYNSIITDVPLRNCHNHKCSNVIMSQNINKLYCSDTCRSIVNKQKNSLNEIHRITEAYKQAVYRSYTKNEITESQHEKIYILINKKKEKLEKNQIINTAIYEAEYTKILNENNIRLKRRK